MSKLLLRNSLPRLASDTIVRTFLKHEASIWVLHTNQIGGDDPDIEPIAPNNTLIHHESTSPSQLLAHSEQLIPVTFSIAVRMWLGDRNAHRLLL
ncbi:MAG: hypothetical protein HC769_20455 [Cyanobacteria bacterium CRU_2_1]|nr:hypothetical protein [Cyanobacteria bacterium CRU_2_1]